MEKKYKTFAEFYPFYLAEHKNRTCRRLHFTETLIVMIIYIFFSFRWTLLLSLPFVGYGFAWVGHFFFEKNRPATFTYPLFSLLGDFAMFKDILIGKIKY